MRFAGFVGMSEVRKMPTPAAFPLASTSREE